MSNEQYQIPRPPRGHSNSSRYFISTKSGMRPIAVPPGESPLAIVHRGRWYAVFRAAIDEEYFRDHPNASWRMTFRRISRTYFTYEITVRDGSIISEGDMWDVYGAMDYCGGSALERLRRAARRLLADQNRTYRARVI